MANKPLPRVWLVLACAATSWVANAQTLDQRVESLLEQMTVEEKAGQLTQYTSDRAATGPVTFKGSLQDDLQKGRVGSMLNVMGVAYTRGFQEQAMKSRLKIPLLFAQDVIHGYKTTFPIPLAEAASWDLPAIEKAARIAATEAAAAGLHWTFAPMVDVARDPRWGRVMEGAGEDAYLGARIAFARVKGFQGRQLGDVDAVMATAKHFAAYGAVQAGREYNAVDMSQRQLWEVHLPPFKAAVDAGAATFMNAFNDVNGVPATGNPYLQRDILKGQWKFQGFVVSDWGSIGELVTHGFVKDEKAAAQTALSAGNDMDMESDVYRKHLPSLIAEGKLGMPVLNDAVRRILRKKFELGLFDDPYKFSDALRAEREHNRPEHMAFARDIAGKSIVLLKNEGKVLPLQAAGKTIAFIGPMVKAVRDNHGAWAVTVPGVDYDKLIVTQWDGLKAQLPADTRLLYAKGCEVQGESRAGFDEAGKVASQADVVIVSVGEPWHWSGEAKSRVSLRLTGVQEDLVRALHATGKPLVVLINAGRPLVFDAVSDRAAAVLYTWWLGSQAGNAIADVLLGQVNPSARLPMSFPRSEGQIPVHYNHFNTGRPAESDTDKGFHSSYIDSVWSPRYAFGYGLSYTRFDYGDLTLSETSLQPAGQIQVTLQVRNAGQRAGDEVVQLYLRDRVASLVRPVKELKDFQKIHLEPGQSKTVQFTINQDKLAFYNADLRWVAEPGEFDLMIGAASDDIRLRSRFELR